MLCCAGECLFDSPKLLNPEFATLLSPMVSTLGLFDLEEPISASQFAFICNFFSLEELSIQGEQVCAASAHCSSTFPARHHVIYQPVSAADHTIHVQMPSNVGPSFAISR
jgi:hypothetical protein